MKLLDILLENKEEYLAKTYDAKLRAAAENDKKARQFINEPLALVNKIAELFDPSKKYLNFLVDRYTKGQFKLEDTTHLTPAIEKFSTIKNTLPNKDINQFKTIGDLYRAVAAATNAPPTISKRQQEKLEKQEGTETIIRTKDFIVLRLLNIEAACKYGSGTKWCTTMPEHAETYFNNDKIYAIMVRSPKPHYNPISNQITYTRKFQFHYKSGQLMNELDEHISEEDIALLSTYPEWYEFIDMMTKTYHGKL